MFAKRFVILAAVGASLGIAGCAHSPDSAASNTPTIIQIPAAGGNTDNNPITYAPSPAPPMPAR